MLHPSTLFMTCSQETEHVTAPQPTQGHSQDKRKLHYSAVILNSCCYHYTAQFALVCWLSTQQSIWDTLTRPSNHLLWCFWGWVNVFQTGTRVRLHFLYQIFFTDLLPIYSDKKYMHIILIPNCTCTASFNFGYFVFTDQW